PDHERHQLGRRELRGEDQIALVLPVLVVDNDHGLAGLDVGDRPLDGVESDSAHRVVSNRRATYLARTSTSRLTGSPGALAPSVVARSVSGISPTSNQSEPTPVTVSDTPSTAIEPFSATKRASSLGRPNRTDSQASPGVRETT